MKQLLRALAVVVPMLLLVTSFAHADQALYLYINNTLQSPTSNSCDPPNGGTVCIYTFINGSTISVNTGQNGGIPQITLTTSTTQLAAGTNTYEIDYVVNNFTPTHGGYSHSESATLAAGDSASSNIYYDSGNSLTPAAGVLVDSLSLAGGTTGISTAVNTSGSFLFGAPYSLTDQIILTLTAFGHNGQVTSSFNTTVPEPASLMLLGSSFLGLAGVLRRKLVKQ
jgi:hypothetical protein